MEDFEELVIKPHLSLSYGEEHDFIIPEFEVPICLHHVEEDEEMQIGVIRAHRFDLSYNIKTLLLLADDLEHDLYKMAEFFSSNEEINSWLSCHRYLFHIGQVYIQPEHRGQDYGLKALAMFLELFATGEMVSCSPHPDLDMSKKFPQGRGQKLLTKYWSKLGLTNYDAKHNILWQAEWDVPSHLKTLS